jgi:hypothetical protein
MELTRDRFIAQFAITFGVHCLRGWSTRLKSAPTHLTACLYEWIKTNGGRMSLSGADFATVVGPVIEDLHRATLKGERPESELVTGRLYDALDAAGVEVTIKPLVMITPAKSHSS